MPFQLLVTEDTAKIRKIRTMDNLDKNKLRRFRHRFIFSTLSESSQFCFRPIRESDQVADSTLPSRGTYCSIHYSGCLN